MTPEHDAGMTTKHPRNLAVAVVLPIATCSQLLPDRPNVELARAIVAKFFEAVGVPRHVARTAALAMSKVQLEQGMIAVPGLVLVRFAMKLPESLSPWERDTIMAAVAQPIVEAREYWGKQP